MKLKNQKENKIIEIIKKNYNNKIIKLKDGSITDGNILISTDYVGEYTENKENIINNPNKLTDLLNVNCNTKIKNDDYNYKKEENIKFKNSNCKNKHCIFYKNKTSKNFIVINQIYFDLIKRIAKDNKIEVEFFVHYKEEIRRIEQIIVKEKETQKIIALIMPIMVDDLTIFDNLPDIVEEEEEEKELNKINSEFIKAEAEIEEEKEKEKEQKVVSAIDKIKSEYLEKKEKRNDFAALVSENKTIENVKEFLKIDNECEQAHKKYVEIQKKHINYITGAAYSGHNAEILNNAMKKYNYVDSVWLGSYQAKKAKLQLKKDNIHAVSIFVYVENKNTGEMFKKYENIYNIADFEKMKKIEDSEEFRNIVEELKNIS